ncbi:hypothetical protein BXZ70DRAFT_1011001 [Cristinia sonorae]|uniref:Uncharacterized protein n=1 Tax=Cristinia sonorae TaxID=1940300 RepID=A0A8K0XLU5_9AGAR|nr:hypothetical protein BXZ70DRAFT_1011001 [Cristinia sonorae]
MQAISNVGRFIVKGFHGVDAYISPWISGSYQRALETSLTSAATDDGQQLTRNIRTRHPGRLTYNIASNHISLPQLLDLPSTRRTMSNTAVTSTPPQRSERQIFHDHVNRAVQGFTSNFDSGCQSYFVAVQTAGDGVANPGYFTSPLARDAFSLLGIKMDRVLRDVTVNARRGLIDANTGAEYEDDIRGLEENIATAKAANAALKTQLRNCGVQV